MPETLGTILANLDAHSWREWVYIDNSVYPDLDSSCIVLNPDEAVLGEDDFTPLAAEHLGMEEFLSIRDLMAVRDNLCARKPEASIAEICGAARYYFENDSFVP